MVYFLTITDKEMSYEGHSRDYFIGAFSSEEEAETIAKRYMSTVRGFCEYPCDYSITEKTVTGAEDGILPTEVWVAVGWDLNEKFDKINVIESDCFKTAAEAVSERDRLKEASPRAYWSVDSKMIGRLNFKDGFARSGK